MESNLVDISEKVKNIKIYKSLVIFNFARFVSHIYFLLYFAFWPEMSDLFLKSGEHREKGIQF